MRKSLKIGLERCIKRLQRMAYNMWNSLGTGLVVGIAIGLLTGGSMLLFSMLAQGVILVGDLAASIALGGVSGVCVGLEVHVLIAIDRLGNEGREIENRREDNYLPRYEDTYEHELLDRSEPGLPKYEDVNKNISEEPPSYEEAIKENNLGNKDGKVSASEVDIDGREGNQNKGLLDKGKSHE